MCLRSKTLLELSFLLVVYISWFTKVFPCITVRDGAHEGRRSKFILSLAGDLAFVGVLFGKIVVGLAIARILKITKAYFLSSPFLDLQNFMPVYIPFSTEDIHDSSFLKLCFVARRGGSRL